MPRFQGTSVEDVTFDRIEKVNRFGGSRVGGEERGPQEKYGKIRSAYEGFKQGVTFGGSEEAEAAVAAATVRPFVDRSYRDLYTKARDDLRRKQKVMKEQHTGLYTAGEVAGSILTGVGAAKMLARKAPAKAGALAAYGTKHPYVAAAGVGGGGGYLYGLGTSEGDLIEKQKEAGVTGALGAALGPAGTLVGRAVLAPLAKKGKEVAVKGGAKFKQAMSPKSQDLKFVADKPEAVKAVVTQADMKALKALHKQETDIFAKTKGQKTQDPDFQRLEDDALAGQFGDEAEKAVRRALVYQSRERRSFLKALEGSEDMRNVNDVVEDVYSEISKQSKSLKGKVDNAYDLAREGGGVKIAANDIKDGLFATIGQIKRDAQYDIGTMPHATKVVKNLAKEIRTTSGKRLVSANLSAMENWRKRVTNAIASTNDRTEKRFLRQIKDTYDDFMYETANKAVDEADEKAIMAFRDAVAKRAEYGRRFESDRFVKDIVEGKKNLDDTVKDLLGTGAIAGKKRMVENYQAILKAAGNEENVVKEDLQKAFAKKIYKQAIEGLEPADPNTDFISAAKMRTALEGLFVNNRQFAKELYGQDAVDVANQAIKELTQIVFKQPSTGNPSGSFDKFARWAAKSKIGALPGFRLVASHLVDSANAMKAREVEKSLADVIDEIPELSGTATLWGGLTGGVIAEDVQGVFD